MEDQKTQKEEKKVKPKKILDYNHGSLKTVFVFDFIGIIATIIGDIWIFIQMSYLGSEPGESLLGAILGILVAYSIIAIIMCVFVRNALLRKGHETIAVILTLIFGIGWNIEFIAALIIASSDLYIDYEDAVDNRVDYEQIFIEIKKINTYYKKNDLNHMQMNEKYIKLKNKIVEYKDGLTKNLESLTLIEEKCGLSAKQKEQKEKLLNEIKRCDEAINLGIENNGLSFGININDFKNEAERINYWVEKSLKLKEDKQKLFNDHKQYYDRGIYSLNEFEQKISFLFFEE
ncbi:MAG: hypothetical protein K6B64_02270 [Acholeplasmatales bacterium]|nr:hypothetical protein [Acholeplasmatales bacterium]